MKYPKILAALRSAKWAVTPATLHAITDTLGARMRGTLHASLIPDRPAPDPNNASSQTQVEASSFPVAVIAVHGILGKNLSSMEMECGGCDVGVISAAIDMALADPAVQTLVLDFDSPGGVVTGIPELCEKIREAATVKQIVAFTGSQCCSAAYWLASACNAIYCTKSADLGSIGVYVALCDDSEWWKKEGYKLELIKAGEFKAMGISGQPLAAAERALIQTDVDAIYVMFTADVRAGRGTIDDATMQGQTFMGERAVGVNLADELVGDLDELIAQSATIQSGDLTPFPNMKTTATP